MHTQLLIFDVLTKMCTTHYKDNTEIEFIQKRLLNMNSTHDSNSCNKIMKTTPALCIKETSSKTLSYTYTEHDLFSHSQEKHKPHLQCTIKH